MIIRDARADELDEVGEIRVAAYVAGGFLSPDSGYAPTLRTLGGDGMVLAPGRTLLAYELPLAAQA